MLSRPRRSLSASLLQFRNGSNHSETQEVRKELYPRIWIKWTALRTAELSSLLKPSPCLKVLPSPPRCLDNLLRFEIPGIKKRRWRNEDTEFDSVFRRPAFAVKSARRKLLRSLTHGTPEPWKKLFTSLLFVLERIWSFNTPEEARQNRDEVAFTFCENEDYFLLSAFK